MRTLIVIPTYQEAANVAEVLGRTREAAPDAEILVVDDGSPDGTADLVERLGGDMGGVHVLRRTTKSGLGTAYRAGFDWGLERGFEAMVEMDADLQHDPAAVPGLLGGLDDGATSLVIGSRYVAGGTIPQWSWHRRALSRYGNRYAGFVLGLGVLDATSGFRAYRADVLAELDASHFRAQGYAFQIETAYAVHRAGGHIIEIPIAFTERARGQSKMSGRVVGEALVLVTWWAVRDRLLRRGRRRAGGRGRSGVAA